MKLFSLIIFYIFVVWQLIAVTTANSENAKCISSRNKRECQKCFKYYGLGSKNTGKCCPDRCYESYSPLCGINKSKKCKTFENDCKFLAAKCKQKENNRPNDDYVFYFCGECDSRCQLIG